MSTDKGSKRNNRYSPRSILALSVGLALIVAASGTGMPLAAALPQKTIDPGFGCGNNWWGVKASALPESNMFWFGKKPNCTVDPAHPTGYKGRTNVLFIHEFRPGDSSQQFATEWQAGIQGADPWGNRGSLDNGINPLVTNTNFPAPATPNYNLKAQWLWTNDVRPLTDQINANYLTNLWLVNSNSYMVIDFVWMQLTSTGNNGNWQQKIYTSSTDASKGTGGAPGYQVYQPYCERWDKAGTGTGNINVFHYNVILDNTSHGSNQWIEKISNINTRLNEATTYAGYVDGGSDQYGQQCTTFTPGSRSSYNIVDIETGIELSAQNFGKSGRVEGGFSNSDLYY